MYVFLKSNFFSKLGRVVSDISADINGKFRLRIKKTLKDAYFLFYCCCSIALALCVCRRSFNKIEKFEEALRRVD